MNKPKIFGIFNYIAVVGHLLSFVTMSYLLSINNSIQYPLTENYLEWIPKLNNTDCPLGSREFDTEQQNFCIVSSNSPVYCSDDKCLSLDLGLLVISFHVLSFVFRVSAG